ncbi:hypothetical protein M9458_036700, partial [Cirrhinus mrigala]
MQINSTEGKKGGQPRVPPTLMEPANHSTEMEKRQIAISSSSERDKGTPPKDTPCSESESHRGKTQQKHPVLSLRHVQGTLTETPASEQQQINLRSESPACKGETTTDTKSKSPAFEAATEATTKEIVYVQSLRPARKQQMQRP